MLHHTMRAERFSSGLHLRDTQHTLDSDAKVELRPSSPTHHCQSRHHIVQRR